VLPGRLSLTERQATIDIKGQTVRALTLLGSSGLFFASLPYVSLGEAVALAYLATLIVILLAPLILRGRWA
jgi:drug/metabolite transporter (DMT)-like permease